MTRRGRKLNVHTHSQAVASVVEHIVHDEVLAVAKAAAETLARQANTGHKWFARSPLLDRDVGHFGLNKRGQINRSVRFLVLQLKFNGCKKKKKRATIKLVTKYYRDNLTPHLQ